MKFLEWSKDGGPESNVSGFFLLEWKGGFSIAILRFANGTRDAYHSHAFNAWSWLLSGMLIEKLVDGGLVVYRPSARYIYTSRSRYHKVASVGTSWALTFRGPWTETWLERRPVEGDVVLTNGRKVVG